MPLPAGLCEAWTPVWTCAIPTGSYAVTGVAVEAATEVLHALSGRQFGLCTQVIRPCRDSCYGDAWPALSAGWSQPGYPTPLLYAGRWFNVACGSCTAGCSCSEVSQVTLPGPVHAVTQVKVDGVVLAADTDYRLDDDRLLVRLGGEHWPLCNDLNLADTEAGTWSVTLQTGREVPTLGGIAVGVLALEFAKLLTCDTSCALPRQVQSISRQGVNIELVSMEQFFENGQTGLYWPDRFIQTYNPRGLAQPSRVYDIDSPDARRRVGS